LFAFVALHAQADLISNGSFETTSGTLATGAVCTTRPDIYPAQQPGAYPLCSATGWTGTYQIGSGTALGIFGVAFGIPQPDPDGHNALILQAELNVFPIATQSVSLLSDGTYALSFFAANRATAGANGPQTISVLLDGTTVGTFGNASSTC
jgi:hypothetical protein